ncbi:amidase signature domain-containing protein [Sordaria brevicollis]|uniref:Amidase signature domain-containing protein n=1 Tax=Sordaria brevicollis TaxID=83679 RepID=A0AAE0P319_SORBR|nr:amidase signature domain-containing protein [Sordaria brevicollis]
MAARPGGDLFHIGAEAYAIAPSSSRFLSTSIFDRLPKTHPRHGLATVFVVPASVNDACVAVDLPWIQKAVKHYETVDDVFHEAFLTTVIFNGEAKQKPRVTPEAKYYLEQLGTQDIVLCSDTADIPPGPYYMAGHELRNVWKLEDDTYGTCMVTVVPKSNPSSLSAGSIDDSSHQFPSFAMPSRIITGSGHSSSSRPLAGWRILVKDNIHLHGTKTSQGSRAFYDTYEACTANAPCMQKLIDKGAIILGKTKMNSFANWEEPMEYVDYQAPWNPRGDQYQSTGGSSSGSAAAVAAYDWLDIAIGTDTWASVTRPALWCGCFGLRPTMGAVSGEGIEPFCKEFDTAGFLGRDLQLCIEFGRQWLDMETMELNPKPFTSIIWPTDFWSIIDLRQVDTARKFGRERENLNALQTILRAL